MNKFQDILAFTRVAELGSFSAAARALSVSVSAVTKSITRIEHDLGVQLLHRTTRRMHLTEYGTEFHERCTRLLADLDEAETSIRGANIAPSGPVRLSLPPSFARVTVVPALPEFYRRYPNVHLDLCLKDQTSNPVGGGYDLAVHSGRLADSRLINRILVRGPQKTVASPAYLERFGRPKKPSDLRDHDCIIGGFGSVWSFRTPTGRDESVRVSGRLATDSGDILREAAVRGVGIAQATWWLFREDFRAGSLVSVLEDYEVQADPISLVFPANKRVPGKVRVVVDFLLEITRDNWTVPAQPC